MGLHDSALIVKPKHQAHFKNKGIEQTLSFGQTRMSYLSGIIGPVSSITIVSFDSIPCNQPFYTSEYQQLSNYCSFKILLDSLRSISIVVNIPLNYSH